jgi:hypothetical protein
MIEHLEMLVEEASVEALLRELFPRFISRATFEVYPHQGKSDLLGKLPARLRGYARYLPKNWRIIVVVDRDGQNCVQLKKELTTSIAEAWPLGRRLDVVSRIAIEELEAWYFGDWSAVQEAFPKVNRTVPHQSAYRRPDAIAGGTWEAFERLLQKAGYMTGGLRKIEAARAIGRIMIPSRNTSPSFQTF